MMLSKRAIKYLLLSTGLVLLYVHQQTAILQLSYSIEKKERKLAELSEHYKLARYQIARLRSPNFLNQQLKAHSFDLTHPKVIEVIKVPIPKVESAPSQAHWPLKSSLIFWMGTVKEAQAKTSSK